MINGFVKNVKKMIQTIQNNETCFIYSYRNNDKTGIYYTLKETNCPLILCQIKSDHEYTNLNDNSCIISIIMNNIGKEYPFLLAPIHVASISKSNITNTDTMQILFNGTLNNTMTLKK